MTGNILELSTAAESVASLLFTVEWFVTVLKSCVKVFGVLFLNRNLVSVLKGNRLLDAGADQR